MNTRVGVRITVTLASIAVLALVYARVTRSASGPQSGDTESSPANFVLGTRLYSYSTQPKPKKGETFVDPVYHVPVTRVTDGAIDHKGRDTIAGYSTWNPLSSDGRYLIFGGNGYLLYNARTFKLVRRLPFEWWNMQDPEPRWDSSGKYPARVYYRRDMQLRYLDVDRGDDGLVHDFRSEFPSTGGSLYIYNGEEGSPSRDSRYWAFIIRNQEAPYDAKAVFTFDKDANKVLATKDVGKNWPNNVMMSPSGDYVYVAYSWTGKRGEFDGPHVYTRQLENPKKVATDVPHLNFGWTAQGHEVTVCHNPGTDFLEMTRLDTGETIQLYPIELMGWNGGAIFHAYSDVRGWAVISSFGGPYDHWSDSQIFAIELDESKSWSNRTKPRVWRIAFTQTAGSKYEQQPNAQMDFAGSRIWWGTNWRVDGGPMDVYQATLPEHWPEILSGSKTGQ